jgi:arylsulfatase A-like enzyme
MYKEISRRSFLKTTATLTIGASLTGCVCSGSADEDFASEKKPNIVVILADDIGYSDLGCYGQSLFPTPNTDKLARESMRFTDAYSNAAVCTPTRYSLLTGNCPFRRYHTSHVLFNGEPLIIDSNDFTLPKMLKKQGYTTGVVGKWHLGLGDSLPRDINNPGRGANDVGFDSSYIVPDGHNMKPGYYIENGRIEGGTEPPFESKIQILDRVGYKLVQHVAKDQWQDRRPDEQIGARLVEKAEEFIESNAEKPFFLYFPTCSIHFPLAPDPRFVGKSKIGIHGDYVMEFDWTVGRVMNKLREKGLAENTLLIVTSDNGGYPSSSSYGESTVKYRPAAPWRGNKGTAYEGGLRVPFIARMPWVIPQDTVNHTPIMISDLPATIAALTKVELKAGEALDSFNIMPALINENSSRTIRPYVIGGDRGLKSLGMRQGDWKLVFDPFSNSMELYNLKDDPGEENDLAARMPEKKFAMRSLLERHFTNGSSRPRAKGKRKTIDEILQEKQRRNEIVENTVSLYQKRNAKKARQ